MPENLRNKTAYGVLWSAIERFSVQGVQFVFGIIMARLLLPTDYGMIGMLIIFLQISQAFIDSGFSDALIQKRDRTDLDYSTVFYFSVVLSVFFYILIYFLAPFISEFYHMPALTVVMRYIALILIFSSLSAIHRTKLTIEVNFKTQSKISLSAAVLSGVAGIIFAYCGYGVWALVIQSLLNAIFQTVFYLLFLRWLPTSGFSLSAFKKLFSFGSKLLLSGLIHRIYYNLYAIVIGRKFSAIELGYYTRAEQFACFPSSNITSIISRVVYPVLSTIQDDNERLFKAYRKYIRISSILIFPLMIGLSVMSKPIVTILLTDKWLGAASLLQILCFDWMFDHLSIINKNLLYVKGRSDLALRVEIVKKLIAISILFVSIPFGVNGICWGRVFYSIIAIYLNAYYTEKFIGLGFWNQIKDIVPFLFSAILMGGIVYSIRYTGWNDAIYLTIGTLVGGFTYACLIYIFQRRDFNEVLSLTKFKI